MRPRELIICTKKKYNLKIILKMQKVVDSYRGKQGTCTVLLASTATLTYSSTGISLLKCQNAWIVYLSLPCPSFERKTPKLQSFNNSEAILQGLPLPDWGSRGCSTKSQGQLVLGWPQEAVRELRRALPAKAELRSQHATALKCWASTKKAWHAVSIVPHQLICKTAAETMCIQFFSDAFTVLAHKVYGKISVICSEHQSSPSKVLLKTAEL